MLEGLDAVEWRELSHAYGVAVDVPELLRLVAGDDAGEAEQALYNLYGSLWNDGRVYPATAAAAPFLIELAVAPALPAGRRVDVLVLLARIGAAIVGDPDDRRRTATALDAGRGSLRPLLDAPEPELRVAAAGLAAVFGTPAREWKSRLRELRDREVDPVIQAHLAVASALAEGRQPDQRDLEPAIVVEPYLASWQAGRSDGLLGRRVSRGAARELAQLLTELSLERA